jgi:hypothetical protein
MSFISIVCPITHPDNLPTDNPCFTRMQVSTLPGVALATRSQAPFPITPYNAPRDSLAGLTQVAARLVAGAAPRCLYHQQPPLNDRLTVSVARTRWGNSQGYVPVILPGVRFATREPAAVIQTVIHAPLFCTFLGVRIWQKSGETQW